MKVLPPQVDGTLRRHALKVPDVIRRSSGIIIFGKRIKSLIFSTDLAIIRNNNADAVFAVYPFTPQPIINEAVLLASDVPVFTGVGGGITTGDRVVKLAMQAESQGSIGVVVNAPTKNEVIKGISECIDIPIVTTIVSDDCDYPARIKAGTSIFNVSAAKDTPKIVKKIRNDYPSFPIIATGGPNDESILETINAGANAITWTPPSTGEIFSELMKAYRKGEDHE